MTSTSPHHQNFRNFWMMRTEDRLATWKDLRTSLADIPDITEALHYVSEFWSAMPTVARHLVETLPGEWPGPWDILADNTYCELTKALGCGYTVALCAAHAHHDIQLVITRAADACPLSVVDQPAIMVDSRWIINHLPLEVATVGEPECPIVLRTLPIVWTR